MALPTKYSLQAIFLLIVLTFTLFQCSDNSDAGPQRDLIGDWKISQASCDGIERPEWKGIAVSFKEITPDSGAYYVPETVRDSIWATSGHWQKAHPGNILIRDGHALVHYRQENRVLKLSVYLPGTGSSPACSDGICLPLEGGSWTFTLEP